MARQRDPYPPLQPGDERAALEAQLDFDRWTVVTMLENLDNPAISARILPATDLTVGGIVKHLAWAEDRWFVGKLLGKPLPEPWASAPLADDPDWPFHSAKDDDIDDLTELYEAACRRSRAAAARFESLDAPAAAISWGQGPVNLRWLLVHMINETAWHLGHLDLLCDAVAARPVRRPASPRPGSIATAGDGGRSRRAASAERAGGSRRR